MLEVSLTNKHVFLGFQVIQFFELSSVATATLCFAGNWISSSAQCLSWISKWAVREFGPDLYIFKTCLGSCIQVTVLISTKRKYPPLHWTLIPINLLASGQLSFQLSYAKVHITKLIPTNILLLAYPARRDFAYPSATPNAGILRAVASGGQL